MKLIIALLLAFIFYSCDNENNPFEPDGKVTAKENIAPVTSAARTGFAPDAELAGIYGRNVSTSGEVDLLDINSMNAFVYIMQSDTTGTNEFYVPVFGAGPVKSPINFNTMLSFIKDTTASGTVGAAFGYLSSVSIGLNATYGDSPDALTTILNRSEVTEFRNAHSDTKIDMFLFPSKAIDPQNGFTNTADWVVNFYSENASLVLWLNTQTGVVTILSN